MQELFYDLAGRSVDKEQMDKESFLKYFSVPGIVGKTSVSSGRRMVKRFPAPL